ncbi:hypothetical protein AGABI1DRAFT_73392 [Agaricus bisporus var. burnettii JB137-S8]|uniref:Actin cytoskeleton-regulatory complex protein SLA1 n=1 Tax=Agaricus bisporus var. burnettii (strain JB137-S8 / ATCC MYA-4627 / FGSC 10392) TaxID=597362 RepID=K5WXS5_AGABU|nr:uncharacterized protein AGABI1DRAFT_73392 [Agaricus bisporus var. burnettii JB137-S8]EKM80311.1 hypothetical protein AGABI1DRAFT_73392 [Agaricus bisporus var. burnettii JB137-S8]
MATSEPERYLAVLKASYDYSPQSDDEIEIKEDQILFLLERTDDDWWKVKVKGSLQDAETPIGLVPAAYVEQAEHDHFVKALYDYEAAAPGEFSINEDDILLAFDLEGDWLLVQSKTGDEGAGYVPGNYVEESTGDESPSIPVITPTSNPRPVSTYVDPADRVAASKVAVADDIKTWSVSEVDKKGKKKKGTLGIGNGAVFFASETDKTPVQKWGVVDVTDITNEKSKHVGIDISGATPVTLLFNVGSKDNVEEIVKKLESSRNIARQSEPSSPSSGGRFVAPASTKAAEKNTVRFSPASPTIIPPREDEDEVEEEEDHLAANGHAIVPEKGVEELAVVLYEFHADGEDELTVAEGEVLAVLDRDGNEWWKCRNAHGSEGVVPASYLELRPGISKVVSSLPPAERSAKGEEDKAEAARAAQEAADRVKAEHLQREEEERAAKERKRSEAQRRMRDAAAATAETERQKRKEAAYVSPKRSPTLSHKADRPSSSSNRQSQDVKFPPADQVRTWHDRTGQFRVDAAFVGFNGGKLRLHKINGVIVEVPSDKMSVDDIKFIEKLTRKSSSSGNGRGSNSAQKQASEDDIPLGTLQNSKSNTQSQAPPATNQTQKPKGPQIDWFDFFLSAGCDVDDCTRYAAAFERDKIDESILPDTTDSTMRSLGLREGDIIRVKKAIDKRKPGENMEKQNAHLKEQVKRDEELARQLQAQETGGSSSKSPAPNLFAGPGGVLKPHRGRRKDTTMTLPKNVDRDTLSSASEQIQRTTSPAITARPGSAPIQPTKAGSLPEAMASSGFEDDAWAPRPSSTKPTPTPAAIPAPAPRVSSPTPPVPSSSAPPPSSAPASVATAATTLPTTASRNLAQTTESDVFDQLARLSQLRGTPQPPALQSQQTSAPTTAIARVTSPNFNPGLGIGSSQLPLNQTPAQQVGFLQSPPQPPPQPQSQIKLQEGYNGPRGPFAPVPANQGLLQPLIPTQTGFNSFIPTRAVSGPPPSTMPYQNQFSPSPFMAPQPTGLPHTGGIQQPMISQQTGMPGLSPSPFGAPPMSASPFGPGSSFLPNTGSPFNPNPIAVQPTGVFARSPFDAPSPMSPSMNSNTNSTAPADVFASMKSGTFAKDEDHSTPQHPDKYNALRPNLAQQPTGWGGYGGYSGI